jgi:hypothetical protein
MKRNPARRPLDFQDLNEVIADVQHLHNSEYDRVANWSLAQVCDHLAIFFRGSLDGFSQKLPWLIRVLFGPLIFRSIIRRRRMGENIKVPRGFLPGDPREDAPAVEQFVGLVQRYQAHADEYQPSPLFGQLTRNEWTQLHLIHCSHHLSFLLPRKSGESTADAEVSGR